MFKIGQRVVCVKENPLKTLKKGKIYTVNAISSDGYGVDLVEQKATDPKSSGYFGAWRFREIDNSWIDELLHKISKEAEEELLVPA